MNCEFEEFFSYCKKKEFSENEMKILVKPLKFYLWKMKTLKYMKIILILTTICSSVLFFETLNWYFCAIGRILMIKVRILTKFLNKFISFKDFQMIPLWDWKNLYNAKCLISNFAEDVKHKTNSQKLNNYNCKLCEDFGKSVERFINS